MTKTIRSFYQKINTDKNKYLFIAFSIIFLGLYLLGSTNATLKKVINQNIK